MNKVICYIAFLTFFMMIMFLLTLRTEIDYLKNVNNIKQRELDSLRNVLQDTKNQQDTIYINIQKHDSIFETHILNIIDKSFDDDLQFLSN